MRKDENRAAKLLGNVNGIQAGLLDALNEISEEQAEAIVLEMLHVLLANKVKGESAEKRDQAISTIESMWDRYQTNLREIEESGAQAKTALDNHLEVLGYDS